ncbi:HAD family hydrolase [Jidongwangia harbinensis]|uniref:HAD family hydrolase n=1 Tax=Jidongwangia harbinensis TaxID=2878561 RepID=UPI001CDA3BAD|nr:HAD-IA family hydrolase [Jidongwangia harbinensis]MCA2215126.1 HAD-IA family hydrolase [Jidongwangia harbinensis]
MLRQPARAMLIDLDGVVRRWDPAVAAAVEARYALEPGVLLTTATQWDAYRPAVTGEITDAEWMRVIAMRLPLPIDDATAAVAEWQQHRGYVDDEVLAFVRDVRAAGRPVALGTNATDRLHGDLETLGLTGAFDLVVSSAELKVHKPAPEFFQRACDALGVDRSWVLFVDDDDRAVRGARAAKMPAYRWSERREFGYLRAALGLS